jgi:hypothetical protein
MINGQSSLLLSYPMKCFSADGSMAQTGFQEREGKSPLLKRIVLVQGQEKRLHTKYFICHLHYAMGLKVPGWDECCNMIQLGQYKDSVIIHKNLGVMLPCSDRTTTSQSIYQ